jgi:hypothetical protein
VQPVKDFQGAVRDFGPGDVMGRAGNDLRFAGVLDPAVFQYLFRLDSEGAAV